MPRGNKEFNDMFYDEPLVNDGQPLIMFCSKAQVTLVESNVI